MLLELTKELKNEIYTLFGKSKVYFIANGLIIHFPEFYIKNTKGQKHKILDLYVRIRMADRYNFYFEGIRTTLTRAEFRKAYSHSHLGTNPSVRNEFQSFCRGEIFGVLCSNFINKPTHHNFMIIMHMLHTYVETESSSGGPHRHMANIYCGSSYVGYKSSLGCVPANNLVITVQEDPLVIKCVDIIEDDQLVERLDPDDFKGNFSEELKMNVSEEYSAECTIPAQTLKLYQPFKFKTKNISEFTVLPNVVLNVEDLNAEPGKLNPRKKKSIIRDINLDLNKKIKAYLK